MADRKFETATYKDPTGKPRTGNVLRCSSCGTESVMAQATFKHMPREAITRYFRGHGWYVGNGPRKDLCPLCSMEHRKTNKPGLKVVGDEQSTEAAMNNVTPIIQPEALTMKAEPPREMTPEDRRIVLAEIEGCYDVKNECYLKGHNDEKVAATLGVPRAWVTRIRTDFFGDEVDEAAKARQEEIKALDHKATLLEDGLKALNREIDAIRVKQETLRCDLFEVSKRIGKLQNVT